MLLFAIYNYFTNLIKNLARKLISTKRTVSNFSDNISLKKNKNFLANRNFPLIFQQKIFKLLPRVGLPFVDYRSIVSSLVKI